MPNLKIIFRKLEIIVTPADEGGRSGLKRLLADYFSN